MCAGAATGPAGWYRLMTQKGYERRLENSAYIIKAKIERTAGRVSPLQAGSRHSSLHICPYFHPHIIFRLALPHSPLPRPAARTSPTDTSRAEAVDLPAVSARLLSVRRSAGSADWAGGCVATPSRS